MIVQAPLVRRARAWLGPGFRLWWWLRHGARPATACPRCAADQGPTWQVPPWYTSVRYQCYRVTPGCLVEVQEGIQECTACGYCWHCHQTTDTGDASAE